MIRILLQLTAWSCCAVCATSGAALKDWAVQGAPYRVVLKAGAAPDAPQAGWEIRLPDFGAGRPDMRDVVLLGADGKEIALDGVWRGPGRSLLMLAESMPAGDAAATLYFGGTTSRQMRSWSAKPSLLMETRRLPEGSDIMTYAGWLAAWKKSPSVDGMAFVPQIFHGGNPFGESSHFLTRYTGLLKTAVGGAMKFYTLSDDSSYVTIDGKAVLKWQKNQPPPLDPRKVPVAAVTTSKGFSSVEYCHAVVDPPAAMALGWEKGGKLGSIPAEAWVHPGITHAGTIESSDGSPVPLGELAVGNYLGYGGEWYVGLRGFIAAPSEGWQVEWQWPDGRVDHGGENKRVWMSLDPVGVIVRLRNGPRVIEGKRTITLPQDMQAASVNDDKQLEYFTALLEKEEPASLPEPSRKAGFVLAESFLPATAASRWAEAWLAVAKPDGGQWKSAMTMAIRELAKRDPQAALDRLLALSPAARSAMGREAELLELDLRVFALKDPMVVALAERCAKNTDRNLSTMARIRLGDYYLLAGRTDDAARCFSEAVPDPEASARKGPVLDRSHSLAIDELLAAGHLDEARAKLDEWERVRPAAKIESDQLYWRARVMFLGCDWKRALQDLETSQKIRPGAPEEIDVLFWKGRALYELGSKEEARKIWNDLVKDYPKHERAEDAKQWAAKS